MNIRRSLLTSISWLFHEVEDLARHRHGGVARIFFLAILATALSVVFVFLSLPFFLSSTRQQSFERVARTDTDGNILDSYARHGHFYSAGIASIIISASVLGLFILGQAVLPLQ